MTSPVTPRVTGAHPAVTAEPGGTGSGTEAQARSSTSPGLRAYTGTDEFAALKPTLQDVLRGNPELKTNQDLINYFYRMGHGGFDGAQKVAGEYGADLNDLCKNRKGSALAYAASIQSVTESAPQPAAAPPRSSGALAELLGAHPEIETNQDLINYCYAQGFNSWDGAQSVAKTYGVDLNALVKDRGAKVKAPGLSSTQPTPAAQTPTTQTTPAASTQTPLQKLLAKHPEIRTNQDFISYCYKQGGNNWDGAHAFAEKYGKDLDALVKDRKGALQAGGATTTPSAPATQTPATQTTPPAASAQTPLQKLLAARPEIQSNQDLINYCFKQGGNDWNRAAAAASELGADLGELVKNRSGSAAAYAAAHAGSAPASGKLDVSGTAGTVTATGTLRKAYDDYKSRIANGVQVDAKYSSQIGGVMSKVGDKLQIIDAIARQADLPREMVAAIWFRESSSLPTDVYLHNGEKLGKTTTLVPKGIYFGKDQFVEAAVHALGMKSSIKNALDLHYGSTDFAAMAAFTEAYNGFGYRNKGYSSAYATAGTNLYHGGRYVADGVFDPNSWDSRPGTLAIMAEMYKRYPR